MPVSDMKKLLNEGMHDDRLCFRQEAFTILIFYHVMS